MQLAAVGRNEPCPCGSGQKHKKCCLGKEVAIAAALPSDLDVVALVNCAIETDDWEPVHDVFDQGFALFEPGKALEHVRFRDDQIWSSEPDDFELAKLCDTGWIRRCEQEICYVLDQYELEADKRDGLRLVIHLLRRFGAKSPVVESIVALQAAEREVRENKLDDALSRLGLVPDDLITEWRNVFAWIEQERPPILPFADWLALRVSPEDQIEQIWVSGTATRVFDICVALTERPGAAHIREHLRLAAIALLAHEPRLGACLAELTSARGMSEDERAVHAAVIGGEKSERLAGSFERIVLDTETRGDFAGAALLRTTIRQLRMLSRARWAR